MTETNDKPSPSASTLAFHARLKAEANLHRVLSLRSSTNDDIHEAHAALAQALEGQLATSIAYHEAKAQPRAPEETKLPPPGWHNWGPLQPLTPKELTGLPKRKQARLAAGCQRCACGAVKTAAGVVEYKLPGAPWSRVRPVCALSVVLKKVAGTDI